MMKIKEAIIVEGIYDKMKLEQFVDATIIPTNGFALFSDKSLLEMIRRLAGKKGIIILTDSDRAGFLIRRYLQSCIPKEQIKHAYIPEITGKEKRKAAPGKEGLLGVEGISEEIIREALKNAGYQPAGRNDERLITKQDLFRDGLYGKQNSSSLRAELLNELQLPARLSVNGLLEVLNSLFTYEEYQVFLSGFLKNTFVK
ncbi:MAG: toprim domain-containing protein [Caldicoprobacterales bacterium]|jgi:ribonuclease M5